MGAGAKFALYPYSAAATCASGKFSFEMPATQENGNLTFGNGANPMIAKSDAQGVLNFKNMCGAIRLQLKGTQKVGKIVVSTATTDEKLSGKATVALDANGLPVVTMDASATNTVTLNCNNAQLNTTAATSFYVVVPAAAYTTGLQFMIYNESGALINSLITTQALTINRSKVAKMPEKTMAATVHFPDARFRAWLKTQGYTLTADETDIDVGNSNNIAQFTSRIRIDVDNRRIASLKGIEYFTGLQKLYCHFNQLTSLDVSKNTALTELACEHNQLTSLNVIENKALTTLWCNDNKLPSLDVSKNTALTYLDCGSNLLTKLNVEPNTKLTYLDCRGNQLTSLDVSKNTALTRLYCHDNKMQTLNTSACLELKTLTCGNQHADGGTGTTYTQLFLTCTKSQEMLITSEKTYNTNVIIRKSIAFPDPAFRAWLQTNLRCKLTSDGTDIDVYNSNNITQFTTTKEINVAYGKNIVSLEGIKYFTKLEKLDCCFNLLTSLDLSGNTALADLDCSFCQLTSLDISLNTALTILNCHKNQLTSLNVSKNTALTILFCGSNQLPSLDVSQNTKLKELSCYANKLPYLDIRPLTSLTFLECGNQSLESVLSFMTLYMTKIQFDAGLGKPTGMDNHNNLINIVYE